MKNIKNPKDMFYISVIALAFIVAVVLCIKYRSDLADRQASNSGTPSLAPKEDKVLVTIDVETIEDGLENMGILVTQEYYFTQVETYTKEKKILNFINSFWNKTSLFFTIIFNTTLFRLSTFSALRT